MKLLRNPETDAYFKAISKIKRVSREEERALALKAFTGDIAARNKLVENNLKFVVHIAKRYPAASDIMDLINEGNMGLIRAAERFDPSKGMHFTSFAVHHIRQRIYDHLYKKDGYRLPGNWRPEIRRIEEGIRILENDKGSYTFDELASFLDMKRERITHILRSIEPTLSLNAGDIWGDSFVDSIICNSRTPENLIEERFFIEEFDKIVSETLKPLEEKIFRLRHYSKLTFREISKIIGVSKQRISQIDQHINRKLLNHPKWNDLKVYHTNAPQEEVYSLATNNRLLA